MARRRSGKSVIIKWSIENFHFCWHKTGERLESPLFNAYFSSRTSWRLWLYPRGEDDGEYVSLFLFREEGGPEVVHVDFHIDFYVNGSTESKVVKKFNEYSFKTQQREGLKCFTPRWKILTEKEDQKDQLVLCLRCVILDRGTDLCNTVIQVLHTRIGKDCVYGTEICDNVTDLDPNCSKCIEVKTMLEDEHLININFSYFEDSLVIKIFPLNCKKIKYAICKVTVIKIWGKESAFEHIRSWIGEIKEDIWRYRVLQPETGCFKPELKTSTDKTFIVHYDFSFSTGEMATIRGVKECTEYFRAANVSFQQYLDAKFAPTALYALKETYSSKSFIDVHIKMEDVTCLAHKAILCARSPKFRSLIGERNGEVKMPFFSYGTDCEDLFFQFLYTDSLGTPSTVITLDLYQLALSYDLEPLKTKCRNILRAHLNSVNAVEMFNVIYFYSELPLRTAIENYIATHYELVIRSVKWDYFENEPDFRKELIFLKYKKQKAIS